MVQVNFPQYGTITVSLPTVTDLAEFSPLKIFDGLLAIVAGQNTSYDGLGGIFTWSETSTDIPDGITVIASPSLPTGRWIKTVRSGLTTSTQITSVLGYIPASNSDLASPSNTKGSSLVTFVDDGVGASAVTAQSFMRRMKQYPSGNWYEEYGAKVQRLNDRVFMGGATKHNGTNSGPQPDWLTTGLLSKGRSFAFQQVAQAAVLTSDIKDSSNAFVAAARTSLFDTDGYGAIGVLGVGWNDNTTKACGAWGGYFEGFRLAGVAGPSYGMEIDIINFGTATSTTPYAQSTGQSVGLQIASAAEFAGAVDATAAINVQANGAKFRTGINFGATSLTGTDGTGTGTATAIAMARGHGLQWRSANTTVTTQIFSTSATTANSTTVNFSESATLFTNSSTGKSLFGINNIGATAANYIQMQASASGNPTQILAAGDDPNIDVQFVPKGTGGMGVTIANVRNFASDAAAASGGVPVGGFYRNGSTVQIRVS